MKDLKRIATLFLSLLIISLIIVGISGCEKGETEKPEVINIGYSLRPLNLPTIVAQEKEMFEAAFAEEGIEVKWHELEGPATTEALAAKSIDYAISLNYVSAIIAKANGNDLKVVSSYTRFPKGIGLLAATDRGINSVQDLKGRKVALQKGTMLQEMLYKALTEVNLTPSDVEIISMTSPDAVNALVLKQVDAVVLPEPLMMKTVATKKATLLRDAEGLILGQAFIVARKDFLEQYPEIHKKFWATHLESLEWVESNKEEALNLAAEVNQMDLKAVKALYPKFDFSPAIDEENISKLKETTEFLKTNNFISKDVDTESLINEMLDGAK
ncbi:MAG: ABC transporter substrate-binding protein [Desulfitobacteriia bacterium]|jgi:sulfonate transport system substrate-binding protein